MLKLELVLFALAVNSALCVLAITQKDGETYGNGATEAVEELNGKLVFANVIFRHGDRTPVDPYPTDPWKDPSAWPNGFGQLTNIGKDQHYHLGQWLRKRYDSILNHTYSNDEVFVRSTDVDRTLMSALSNLAGLFPPVDNEIWNKNLPWQPIPVHTIPEKMDNLLAGKAPCPAFDYALSALRNTPEFQEINKKYSYLYDYLTENTGRTVDTLEAVEYINNTLLIETIYNKTLPEWTKKVYPGPDMTFVSEFTFTVNTYTRQLARLKIGPLIREMLEHFKAKASGKLKPDRSLWIYSAHDTTIANVLHALNIFELHSPPYTACIMLELRLDEHNNPFISIFYKNTSANPRPMNIPGCGTACPLKKMFALYKDILPVNWERECKLTTMMMTYEQANIGLAMGILVAIIVVMLVCSYTALVYYRRRNYSMYNPYSQMA